MNQEISGDAGATNDTFITLEYEIFLERLLQSRLAGEPVEILAYQFHAALADGIKAVCETIRTRTGLSAVALSGGCFCNRLLLQLTEACLKAADFRVLTHHQIPANDGGIALGQAVYAMRRLQSQADLAWTLCLPA